MAAATVTPNIAKSAFFADLRQVIASFLHSPISNYEMTIKFFWMSMKVFVLQSFEWRAEDKLHTGIIIFNDFFNPIFCLFLILKTLHAIHKNLFL